MAGFTGVTIGRTQFQMLQNNDPALPARFEGTTWSNQDIGKPVKLLHTANGMRFELCADGDEPIGFVQEVRPGTNRGVQYGSVRHVGYVQALDVDGTLEAGDYVVAAPPVAIGTHALGTTATSQDPAGQVKVDATATKWVVMETYGTGVDRPVVLMKV